MGDKKTRMSWAEMLRSGTPLMLKSMQAINKKLAAYETLKPSPASTVKILEDILSGKLPRAQRIVAEAKLEDMKARMQAGILLPEPVPHKKHNRTARTRKAS